MPKSRPHLSITLPRNFTFHYKEGDEPQTPEQETVLPPPSSPRAEGPYRIKRRSRPAAASLIQHHSQAAFTTNCNIPLASIEHPAVTRTPTPLFQQARTEPLDTRLGPVTAQRVPNWPHTPEPQDCPPSNRWNSQPDIGDSITRPLSVCSILSDSSDGSDGSLTSYPTGDGSCTSPESDAPDPFKFSSIRRGKGRRLAAFAKCHEASPSSHPPKKLHSRWTPEMDRHLWSTYLVYLQDPTVTPFKMLPGVAPPLGVCHRVSREARKSWRIGVVVSPRPYTLPSPFSTDNASQVKARPCSPATIRANAALSGSNTPTKLVDPRSGSWPKSGSSTRRRLRLLCKRRPTIAPHYQRLLQSRSPSPFSSSARSQSRSQSRLSEVTSPLGPSKHSFGTRDVHLSLTASTSDTMQPGGPLARLATNDPPSRCQPTEEWFNEPPVPFASEIPIPSDAETPASPGDALQTPRLGSPFGFHTWGPSRSKQRLRPDTARFYSSGARHIASSLRSPLILHDTSTNSGVHKRRARHQLEEELSPGGSNVKEDILTDPFASPTETQHRRVRSRGFSLGDVTKQIPLQSLFTPSESADRAMRCDSNLPSSGAINPEPKTPTNPLRLESPFQGLSSRSLPRRHVGSNSLGANSCNPFSSIAETLGRASNQHKAGCQEPKQ